MKKLFIKKYSKTILTKFMIWCFLLILFSSSLVYAITIQLPQEPQKEMETEALFITTDISEINEQHIIQDSPEITIIEEQQNQTDTSQNKEPEEPQTPIIINENKVIIQNLSNTSEIEEPKNQTDTPQNPPAETPTSPQETPVLVPFQIPFFPPLQTPIVPLLEEPINSSPLHTDGRWIKNQQDQIIHLKGVNKPSLEWRTDGLNWIESDWDTIESWNANVVRIPFKKSWWDTNKPTDDGMLYREKIAQAVMWGSERGIYTIIDMHWWDDNNYLIPMPSDVEDWIKTWEEIAHTYKNDHSVLFDIWNEPHSISGSMWWPEAQECVDRIRSTGAQNLILVGVLNYSHDARLVEYLGPIKGENIVYSCHLYPHEFDGSDDVSVVKNKLTDLGWKYILDNNIAPVIIGEFGANFYKTEEVEFMKAMCRIANGQENNDGTDWTMSFIAWWFIPYPEEHALVYDDWETPTASGNALIDGINAKPQ